MKAANLSEPVIIALLAERPDAWHTHWTVDGPMPRVYDPTHPDAPPKVLLAKLRAMDRKGLIVGCGCGCRGDWHLPTEADRALYAATLRRRKPQTRTPPR